MVLMAAKLIIYYVCGTVAYLYIVKLNHIKQALASEIWTDLKCIYLTTYLIKRKEEMVLTW